MRRWPNKKLTQYVRSRASLLAGLGLLAFLLVSFTRTLYRDREIRVEIRQLEAHAAKLEKQKNQSQQWVAYLKSDAYLEHEARKNFGYAKPGEKVVIIEGETSQGQAEGQRDRTNPQKWFAYFFSGQ